MTERRDVASWRIILAFILDLLSAFVVFGLLVGWIFGGATDTGFQLEGWRALLAFALIVAYFVVFDKFLGGTIWKRILRAVR
jgi:Na+/melibiose symporter-like transporter